jgi:hypothetical protein
MKNNTILIVGGAAALLIVGYLVYNKLKNPSLDCTSGCYLTKDYTTTYSVNPTVAPNSVTFKANSLVYGTKNPYSNDGLIYTNPDGTMPNFELMGASWIGIPQSFLVS